MHPKPLVNKRLLLCLATCCNFLGNSMLPSDTAWMNDLAVSMTLSSAVNASFTNKSRVLTRTNIFLSRPCRS